VRNQIDRFNSQRDLSNAAAPVHHDIDMSQEGRPILKLDAEASFRYVSNGPRISPSTNVQADADVSNDLVPEGTQSVKKFPLRAKVEADTGSEDDDEVVAPYEEDKYTNSPAAPRNGVRIETRTVAGAISGFDDAGWNGEIEEDQDGGDGFNALTASMPNAAPRRRSSNASLNSLRPLSRLHPNKFRDSMSTDPCDLDDEDYSDSEEEEEGTGAGAGAAPGSARPPQHHRHPRRKDTVGGRREENFNSAGSFDGHGEVSSGQVTHVSSSTQRTTTEHRSSSSISTMQSTHSQHPPSYGEEPLLGTGNSVVFGGNKVSPPPTSMTNEQRQQQFSHGGQGSWSSGAQSSQSSLSESAESKSALAQQSAKNVQQLAVEEKMALLNAGRSPRQINSTITPKLTPPSPSSQQAAVSAMNVKVGTKKLTIRGAQQSQSQDDMLMPPPPGYDDDGPPPSFDQHQQQHQQRALPGPPLPPPAYDESMMDDLPRFPAEESLPDFLPDSDEEDEDGMNQEQRTATLMAKYKRRSYMKPNATPEAFRDLEPVDPAVAKEALLRREQELKNAGTWVPPASLQAASAAAMGHIVSDTTASSSSNVNTTESLAGGTITPPSQLQETEEYVHVVPTHTAVEAVMHKESNDLIEELVQQGYSRENAISLAKEIELDRRAGRFYNNQNGNFSPPRSHSSSSYAAHSSAYGNNSTNGVMSWQEAAAAANNAVQYTTYNNKNPYGVDDELGTVISNISAASRQSNYGETDRLLMNLLLTQQKTRFGVNMYESLQNADEPQIERYMNKGMSLDQAVLKLFERKYGSVESQQLPRQVMPHHSAGGGSVSGSSIAVDSDEAHEIVEAMHAEIELLMLSGNYSREVAVRMLLNKVAKERALKQQHAGGLSLNLDMDPHHPHHAKSMHRASSMNAMGSPTGRGGYTSGIGSARGGNGDLHGENGYGASAYQEGISERRLHSARSMYDSHSSRNGGGGGGGGGGSVVSERSNRSHNMPVPHHLSLPGDHRQDDYIAHYHEQEYGRGPNGLTHNSSSNRERTRSGDKYIIHHHYQAPPPTPVVQSSTTHTSNVSVTSNSHGGSSSRRRPSASNASVMSGSSRGVDDNAYIPTLLAEQEAKYGVNMFEYLAPDDPEVSRLMREFNFTRTDAMIAVFQQFPPQVATPTPTYLNSGSSNKSTGSGGTPKGISAHSPMKPPLINTNYNNLSANSMHSSGSQSGSHATAAQSRPLPVPSNSAYDEDAELERVMKLSMQEHNNKPGAVSMPGTNSKATTSSSFTTNSSVSSAGNSSSRAAGGYSGGNSQDVATLVGMGFTSEQAQAALARHNFDVHKAADYLLGCM